MVGGGAETQGDYGLLQASYDGLGGWRANAKDHCAAGAYPLRAYSIGLRVDGLTQAQLNQFMTFNEAYSVPAQHPSVKAYVPPGFQLIGGYAWAGELGWSPTGQLLVASAAGNDVNGDYWYAESKDHCVAVSASVYAAVIGITNDPIPGVGLIHRSFWNNVVYCPGGFCTATISVGSGHALTSVGAWGSYNGAGRLLTQLVPFANWPAGTGPGATVKSKDHVSGDSGNLGAQWVGIWADP
jgi:hypothetical protein